MMIKSPTYLLALAALSCMAIPSIAAEPVAPVPQPTCKRPAYPDKSLERGEEGINVFGFLVRPDGTVAEARLLNSSGSRDLDRVAQLALSKCIFERGAFGTDTGERWARVVYSWILEGGDELAQAKQAAAIAANRGNVGARYHLSLMLSSRAKTDAEREQALLVLRSAAALGHAHAQFDLGQRLEKGDGVKANLDEALRWYQKSAEKGDPMATQRLAIGTLTN